MPPLLPGDGAHFALQGIRLLPMTKGSPDSPRPDGVHAALSWCQAGFALIIGSFRNHR